MKTTILLCCTLVGVHLFVMAHEETNTTTPLSNIINLTPLDVQLHGSNSMLHPGINPVEENSTNKPPLESPMGRRCECGLFKDISVTENDIPILSQSPISVSCDYAGQNMCLQICFDLSKAAEEFAPRVFCASLGHYNQLIIFIHYRICGAKNWSYTGLNSPNGFCCHEHKVIDCNQVGNGIN